MQLRTIMHWISFAVYVYIFGYAGLYKVIRLPSMMEGMESMGFGATATLWIGWAETMGVLGLISGIFVPKAKPVAVLFLWPFGIGALATHLSHGHGFNDYWQSFTVCIMAAIILKTDRHFRVSITNT